MLRQISCCFLMLASPVFADGGTGQETFLSCQIADRDTVLEVRFDATTAYYSYGPPDAPELVLETSMAELQYLPWPGVGRAIWEEVTFDSGGYSYAVYAGFERPLTDEEASQPLPTFGGVNVSRDNVSLAQLACAPDTVDFAWGEGLWDAKIALGQIWNDAEQRWTDAAD